PCYRPPPPLPSSPTRRSSDLSAMRYESHNLQLKTPYTMSYEREIDGSVDYINRHLAAPGRPVEIFLWSGNCRPGPEALARVRQLDRKSTRLNSSHVKISYAVF